MRYLAFLLVLIELVACSQPYRCLMYLSGYAFHSRPSLQHRLMRGRQHPIVPEYALTRHITHVALAFMKSDVFNAEAPTEWPLFTTISETRPKFYPGTKIVVSIGGWGDTAGFDVAARDKASRGRWVENVARMVEDMGADGRVHNLMVGGILTMVQVSTSTGSTPGMYPQFSYRPCSILHSLTCPSGNGDDYKKVPNSERTWQIQAFPLLIKSLREALPPHKLLTAALPSLERDMMAYTPETVPEILAQLDFVNVMTFDMLNRRDNVTGHQAGVVGSRDAVGAYVDRGAEAGKMNLGLPFFVKWFETEACAPGKALGCPMPVLEDPATGDDLGRAGAFSFHDEVPAGLGPSFNRALTEGRYDEVGGGYYYWDRSENRFWTFDTPEAVRRKVPALLEGMGLGGVFAWGLGEDADEFARFKAVELEMERMKRKVSSREL